MKLKDILSDKLIIIPLKSIDKEDIIKEMVDHLYKNNKIEDQKQF